MPYKRWGLAVPEMMAGNILPMIYNEFIQPWKEISRTSPHTWSLYWDPFSQWEWDDNHFTNNQIFHPVQGNFYFNAARSNGFGYYWSTAFALVGSYLWECCSERRNGSYNDLANTTLGGAALGEMLYRSTSSIIDQEARGLNRIGLEALVFPLNAVRFTSRGIYGQWDERGNPPGRMPDQLGLSVGPGLRWTGSRPHGVLDIELRYGSLYGSTHDSPFDRFTVNAQLNGRDQTIGLVQVEGHLANWLVAGVPIEEDPGGWVVKVILLQNYDFLDSAPHPDSIAPGDESGYRYGGQSLGAGVASVFPLWGLRVEVQGQGDFIPIGAVNSIYSQYSAITPERVREYDFGLGYGLRGKLAVGWPGWGRVAGSLASVRLYTLSGSNIDLGNGPNNSTHRVTAATLGLKLEIDALLSLLTGQNAAWARDLWVGGDFLQFWKFSHYTNPNYIDEHHTSRQWRIMVTWDLTR